MLLSSLGFFLIQGFLPAEIFSREIPEKRALQFAPLHYSLITNLKQINSTTGKKSCQTGDFFEPHAPACLLTHPA